MVYVEEKTDLAWDAFLDDSKRKHVEGFQKFIWPTIRREIASEYGIVVEDEPHWVDSGQVVFWQRPLVRQFGGKILEGEWEPVSPRDGLPVQNANQMVRYFNKGMRLRPGKTDLKIVADNPVVKEEPAPPAYTCERHGENKFAMPNWKSYAQHCFHHMEELEAEPPENIKRQMREFPYFCKLCNVPFKSLQNARRHFNDQRRKGNRNALMHKDFSELEMTDGRDESGGEEG